MNRERLLMQAAVYGPLAIYNATGKPLPEWVKITILLGGVIMTTNSIVQLSQSFKNQQNGG